MSDRVAITAQSRCSGKRKIYLEGMPTPPQEFVEADSWSLSVICVSGGAVSKMDTGDQSITRRDPFIIQHTRVVRTEETKASEGGQH